MAPNWKTWIVRGALTLIVGGLAVWAWRYFGPRATDEGLASGNGRIEAVEIDVSSRVAGRVKELRVAEGAVVTAGQVLALIETDVLDAQRRQAEARRRQAQSAVATARSQLAQRESDKEAARAAVALRDAELKAAQLQLSRSAALADKGFISPQAVDTDRTRVESALAAVRAAKAQVVAAEAAIASAHSQVLGAQASAAAEQADVERFEVDINDAALKAPRDGRVQYLVAQPGEIVAAGGRVLSLIDLREVYMTFFLPTATAGQLALGAEVRLVLDAAPQYVIPAKVSFVAAEAQFTPKAVETASEREKLMFRVKAQVAPELLDQHLDQVKTGLPGMAYVRLDLRREWPARLQLKAPP